MQRYKCVSKREFEIWLTVGKIYEGEIAVTPRQFAGWIEIKKADDGYPAYIPANQFATYNDLKEQGLGV